MIFHIVKQNETLKDIIFKYGLDKSEIMSNNRHIGNWDMLVPGLKLKIPVVNNNLYEHLEEVEPFIEDYYPKDNYDINQETSNNKVNKEEKYYNQNEENVEYYEQSTEANPQEKTKDVSINLVPNEPTEMEAPKISKYVQEEYSQEQYNQQENNDQNDQQYNQQGYNEQYQNNQQQYDHQQYQENYVEESNVEPLEYNVEQNTYNNVDYNQQDFYEENQDVLSEPTGNTQNQNVGLGYQNANFSQVNPYMQINNSIYPAYYYRLALANQSRNLNQAYRVIFYDPYRNQYYYY